MQEGKTQYIVNDPAQLSFDLDLGVAEIAASVNGKPETEGEATFNAGSLVGAFLLLAEVYPPEEAKALLYELAPGGPVMTARQASELTDKLLETLVDRVSGDLSR